MPTFRSPSLLHPLLFLFLLTSLVYLWHRLSFRALHDDALRLRTSTPLFSYHISTARNTFGNRCAVLRCIPSLAPPPLPRTVCDVVSLTPTPVKAAPPSLCLVDYVTSNWDALSRTYNDGLFSVSPSVALRFDPALLPIVGKAVHFPLARDARDISPAWFSVFPSNVSLPVFRAWHKAAVSLQKDVKNPAHVALNRARNCRNKDVECHPRDTAIAQSCDGLRPRAADCVSERRPGWLQSFFVALALLAAVNAVLDAVGGFVPRRRLAALRAMAGGDWGARRREMASVAGLGLMWVVLLAGVPRWAEMVKTVARPLSVSVRHRVQNVHVEDAMDAFAGAADLRGAWEGYAYVLADGVEWVRLSGPGVGVVVVVVGWVMRVREAADGGLLVQCFMMVAGVKVVCVVAKLVGGISERRSEEEEEYAERREAGMFRRNRERSRSFLSQRDLAERERGKAKVGGA